MKTYFITTELGKYIKIGKSKNPAKRLLQLQTAHHSKLKLVLILQEDLEKQLHLQFAKYRVQNEWFLFSKSIKDYIDSYSIPKKKVQQTSKLKLNKEERIKYYKSKEYAIDIIEIMDAASPNDTYLSIRI